MVGGAVGRSTSFEVTIAKGAEKPALLYSKLGSGSFPSQEQTNDLVEKFATTGAVPEVPAPKPASGCTIL
jgi:hypothetical protein